jgi:MYXO-CTERM domain-containing protein
MEVKVLRPGRDWKAAAPVVLSCVPVTAGRRWGLIVLADALHAPRSTPIGLSRGRDPRGVHPDRGRWLPGRRPGALCDTNCTATACGNGVVTSGEGCDDGNLVSGDGCGTNCTATACGNGVVTAGEGCDDGNLVDGDGCTATCTVESAPGDPKDGGGCGCGSGPDGSLVALALAGLPALRRRRIRG